MLTAQVNALVQENNRLKERCDMLESSPALFALSERMTCDIPDTEQLSRLIERINLQRRQLMEQKRVMILCWMINKGKDAFQRSFQRVAGSMEGSVGLLKQHVTHLDHFVYLSD